MDKTAQPMRVYRKHAAKLARTVRAMYPGLVGGWSRRQWNIKVQQTIDNYISRMLYDDRRKQDAANQKAGEERTDATPA